jgi:hypothetical protein
MSSTAPYHEAFERGLTSGVKPQANVPTRDALAGVVQRADAACGQAIRWTHKLSSASGPAPARQEAAFWTERFLAALIDAARLTDPSTTFDEIRAAAVWFVDQPEVEIIIVAGPAACLESAYDTLIDASTALSRRDTESARRLSIAAISYVLPVAARLSGPGRNPEPLETHNN